MAEQESWRGRPAWQSLSEGYRQAYQRYRAAFHAAAEAARELAVQSHAESVAAQGESRLAWDESRLARARLDELHEGLEEALEHGEAIGRKIPLGGITDVTGVDFKRPGYEAGNIRSHARGAPTYTSAYAQVGINCVTSRVSGGNRHIVAVDIDAPVEVYPSSTPGHFHLYINKEMSWEHYEELLTVMARVGILEPGFALASQVRGYSCLRLPWVKKERKVVDGETAVMAAMDPA